MKDKLLEIAGDVLKNEKNQRALILILSGLLAFGFGYMSKTCPSKSDVCKVEFATIKAQFTKLSEKDGECTKSLRKQRDDDDKQCKLRISKEVARNKEVTSIVSCEEVIALHSQCKKRLKNKGK